MNVNQEGVIINPWNPPVIQPHSPKPIFPWLVLILTNLASLIVGLAISSFVFKTPPPATTSTAIEATPTPAWKTYSNSDFSFEYPGDYKYQLNSGSGVYLAPSQGKGGNGPKFLEKTDTWLEVSSETSIDFPPDTPKTPVLIGGLSGNKYVSDSAAVAGEVAIYSYVATVLKGQTLYSISLSSWDVGSLKSSERIFDQILSTFKFTSSSTKTYISKNLGVSFSYVDRIGDRTTRILEEGNKIYIDGKEGQWVQVFSKQQSETLIDAIKRTIKNVDPQKCNIFTETYLPAQSNFEYANIKYIQSIEGDSFDLETWLSNSTKYCTSYAQQNGISYFAMDSQHSDKFVYFSIGQYIIPSAHNNDQPWQSTLNFTD